MGLTDTIARQGGTARRGRVTATVTADKSDAGIKVVSSHRKATVEGLEGIDKAKLGELAAGAEKGCHISNSKSRIPNPKPMTSLRCVRSCSDATGR